MKFDFVYRDNAYSTYFYEKGQLCHSLNLIGYKFRQIEKDVKESITYADLVKKYEIKTLDHGSGLKELKVDRIRVIHFVYHDDTFVYLGTFLKKTKKTPFGQIVKNNLRIKRYLEERKNEND